MTTNPASGAIRCSPSGPRICGSNTENAWTSRMPACRQVANPYCPPNSNPISSGCTEWSFKGRQGPSGFPTPNTSSTSTLPVFAYSSTAITAGQWWYRAFGPPGGSAGPAKDCRVKVRSSSFHWSVPGVSLRVYAFPVAIRLPLASLVMGSPSPV